jgi:hypothetical protein
MDDFLALIIGLALGFFIGLISKEHVLSALRSFVNAFIKK